MSLKFKLFLLFVLIGILSVGFAVLRSGSDGLTTLANEAGVAPSSSQASEEDFTPPALISRKERGKMTASSLSIERVEAVTLNDISAALTPAQATVLFQRLSSELIIELKNLEENTDRTRIGSRLTPIVQKFYYLNRAFPPLENDLQRRLPESFQADIQILEELWTNNSALAGAADDLFARFDLLNHEHIPYQLRNELVLQ